MNLKDLNMSIGEMLKYREILSEKADKARQSGNTRMLNPTLMRMDQIDMLIDIAFQSTVMSHQPFLAKMIDINMFDRDALKSILEPARLLGLPTQGCLNFQAVEDVVDQQPDENRLTSELVEMLKRNFTGRINDAVSRYREVTGTKEPDAKVWIKIKDLVASNTLVRNWDKVICNKVIEEGPVTGFFMAKKHLPNWSDVDLALLIDNAVMRATEDSVERREKALKIMEDAPGYISLYMRDKEALGAIEAYEKLHDPTEVGQRMSAITRMIAPSKRARLLSKKEYVEKGY